MRRSASRYAPPQKRIVLVQCEGNGTEYNYFLGVRRRCGQDTPFRLAPRRGDGGDALAVVTQAVKEVENAEERQAPYDEKCCVLDVETIASADSLNKAVALAAKYKITLLLSNPSFEVWLIAHFERIARPFRDGADAKDYFEHKHWRPLTGRDYVESDPAIYSLLQDRVQTACDNAQWVKEVHHSGKQCRDANSSTDVYTLLQRLLSGSLTPG